MRPWFNSNRCNESKRKPSRNISCIMHSTGTELSVLIKHQTPRNLLLPTQIVPEKRIKIAAKDTNKQLRFSTIEISTLKRTFYPKQQPIAGAVTDSKKLLLRKQLHAVSRAPNEAFNCQTSVGCIENPSWCPSRIRCNYLSLWCHRQIIEKQLLFYD